MTPRKNARPQCSETGCNRPHYARGLCRPHYAAVIYREKHPRKERTAAKARPVPHISDAERFWSKVDKDGPIPDHCPHLGRCWIWTAPTTGKRRGDYGLFKIHGATHRAHRVALELSGQPVRSDPGWIVMHLCDNPPCVNPDHLLNAKQADNLADMTAKGRRRSAVPEGDTHYTREGLAGLTTEQRFWALVEKTDDHWIWHGGTSRGVPLFRLDPKAAQTPAAHLAWTYTRGGVLPAKLNRQCNEPRCVRPEHRAGRARPGIHDHHGTRNPAAKLNPEKVREIRALAASGATLKTLAARYSVTDVAIGYVLSGRTWKHVV